MDLFKGQNLIEFTEQFKTTNDCLAYLAHHKWKDSYSCIKCGHTKSQIRKNHSRTCNKCSHTESAMANTLFHKVKFGIQKAFFICFEMSTTTKSLSANYVSARFGVTEKTARYFMHKVRTAMASSRNYPIEGTVHVDEFVIGGKEDGKVGRSYNSKKKKVVCAVELSKDQSVKRMYALKIDNYSSKELKKIFTAHISTTADVQTDKWKGYKPLMNDYSITQTKSNGGENFIILHTMIHQVKSWIRTIYSSVSEFHVDRYLNEFCYRINRSQMKENIFDNLIGRMIKTDKIYQKELVCT